MPNIKQRQLVEVKFRLPGGDIKPHPVIVLSNKAAIDGEGAFVGVMLSGNPSIDEFTFEINSSMLTKPLKKDCQVRSHLIALIEVDEVTTPNISEMKIPDFNKLISHINENVFSVT